MLHFGSMIFFESVDDFIRMIFVAVDDLFWIDDFLRVRR